MITWKLIIDNEEKKERQRRIDLQHHLRYDIAE